MQNYQPYLLPAAVAAMLILFGIFLIAIVITGSKRQKARQEKLRAEEAALIAALENTRTEREFEIAKIKLQLFRDKHGAADDERAERTLNAALIINNLSNITDAGRSS